ncbi:MAG: lipoyl(octanoyl) transferase LipB [Hyphomonadaceae bacterium]
MNEAAKVGWAVSSGLIAYEDAVAAMETRAAAIAEGAAGELVWLLEHPPLYTAGVSAKPGDLLDPSRFPVFQTGRGGQFTYHGPGQRVAYVMLDLRTRGRDVSKFVANLERWLIAALAGFDVTAHMKPGLVGVWVDRADGGADKIAAIGVRLRKWISFHGIAFNVAPELEHFSGITPCGVSDPMLGITSLAALGKTESLAEADAALRAAFHDVFGLTETAPPPI